ncbi:MAG: YraN family protein [Clostridia bacterium]|nr:YraN family protein [Clostridia bacterium]
MKKYGLGFDGEAFAAEYLEGLGFTVLEKNFISRFGEIDIIAKTDDGKYLCFVEVKTRKSGKNYASGLESVSAVKQNKIIKTAEYYIAKNSRLIEREKLQPRFDCIEINIPEKDGEHDFSNVDLKYIANAFGT